MIDKRDTRELQRIKEYYIITNDYYMLINKELEPYNSSTTYYVFEDDKYINTRDLANSIYTNKKDTSTPEDI